MPGVVAVNLNTNLAGDIASISSKQDNATRLDSRTLSTLADVLSCLSTLQSEEADLSNSLEALMATREPIEASLDRLQSIVPQLEELHIEATHLSTTVSATAQTAERIGGKVRSLDEEMRRVREAGDRVSQVIDLKVTARILSMIRALINLFRPRFSHYRLQ